MKKFALATLLFSCLVFGFNALGMINSCRYINCEPILSQCPGDSPQDCWFEYEMCICYACNICL